jgi:hypothetical protein
MAFCSTLIIVAVMTGHTAAPQPSTDAQRVVLSLETGSVHERASALGRIQDSSTLQQDPAVRAAVRQALLRVRDVTRAIEAAIASTPPGVQPTLPSHRGTGEAESEYELALVRVATLLADATWAEDLTWFTGSSAVTIKALANFGDAAFPPVVSRYSDPCFERRDCTPTLRFGLLETLANMVAAGTLSATNQGVALNIATEALGGADDWQAVCGALQITAASCDTELIRSSNDIANGVRTLTGENGARMKAVAARTVQRCATGPK